MLLNSIKKLSCHEDKPDISLGEIFWDEHELLTNEERLILEKPFSEEEIKLSIDGSYACGAPGLDGFSFLFYQRFWPVIKNDFMALVKKFEDGTLDVPRLKFTIITLIPK